MSKKKQEHIVFDRDRRPKKRVDFTLVNREGPKGPKQKKQVKKP